MQLNREQLLQHSINSGTTFQAERKRVKKSTKNRRSCIIYIYNAYIRQNVSKWIYRNKTSSMRIVDR